MKPNEFQQDLLGSVSRITVAAVQPGAGATVGLLMKLYQDCIVKDKRGSVTGFKGFGIYHKFGMTDPNSPGGPVELALELFKGSRYSAASCTLTTADGVKIKFISDVNYPLWGVTSLAIDSRFKQGHDYSDWFLSAGHLNIAASADLLSSREDGLFKAGIFKEDESGKAVFPKAVSIITGYMHGNHQNLHPDYPRAIFGLRPDDLYRLMAVEIK